MSCGKTTRDDLKRRQSLPLQVKVNLTEARISQWYERYKGLVYISFSGGKDSTVLLHIAKRLFPDIPAVFCDTGLEYPEVRDFALSHADVVIKPKLTFKAVIEKYGYPFPSKEQAQYIRQYRSTSSEKLRNLRWNGSEEKGRFAISKKWRLLTNAPFEVSEKCCDVMKKSPFHKYEKDTKRKPIIGTMATESRLRLQKYLQNGCNSFDAKNPNSAPLSFWTEQDILNYLVENKLEYATCYGNIVNESENTLKTTGVSRTGCMFCLFGIAQEKEPNRLQKMQTSHPKQWAYCVNNLGIGKVLDWVSIPYKLSDEELESVMEAGRKRR